jgi:hypothetical protein
MPCESLPNPKVASKLDLDLKKNNLGSTTLGTSSIIDRGGETKETAGGKEGNILSWSSLKKMLNR